MALSSSRRGIWRRDPDLLRGLPAVILSLVLLAASSPTAPGVEEARTRLSDARARLDGIEIEIDRLAALYERDTAHLARLDAEADRAADGGRASARLLEESRRMAIDAVRRAYMDPSDGLRLLNAWVRAADVSMALHGSALLDVLPWVLDADADLLASGHRVLQGEHVQQQTVRAAVDRARRDLEETADQLERLLPAARAEVDASIAALETAETTASLRESTVRDSGRRVVGGGGWEPPPVMACPLGLPNGFSPSWGAPRSGGRGHEGVDMFAARGMPVFAAADGTVRVGRNGLGGLTVDLYDVAGNRYYYAHLDSVGVTSGQQVAAGDTLGGAGTSGNAAGTPPHLHWQVHPGGGGPTDPFPLADALCRT